MSEWWTYSLSDFLLFSPRTYYRLFELYNAAIWPLQVLALALGAAVLGLLLRDVRAHPESGCALDSLSGACPFRKTGSHPGSSPGQAFSGTCATWRGRAIAAILAACWLWVAWAYLLVRYDTINWAASYFAVGFAIEALLLLWTGIIRDRLRLRPSADWAGRAGLCIFLFALVVHPLIGPLVGRPWLQVEVFGVAPDPTAIATLAVLVAAQRPHWLLMVVPLLWCAVSGATLWTMASPDALVVPAAALVALVLAGCKSAVRARQASPERT